MAYWEINSDGTHFCSNCGYDALYNDNGEEKLTNYCPHCGELMAAGYKKGSEG